MEAEPKQKPVITPEGSIAASREKPSYHPMLLDVGPPYVGLSGEPAVTLALGVPKRGIAELSSAW
jgi:hypothetical protein